MSDELDDAFMSGLQREAEEFFGLAAKVTGTGPSSPSRAERLAAVKEMLEKQDVLRAMLTASKKKAHAIAMSMIDKHDLPDETALELGEAISKEYEVDGHIITIKTSKTATYNRSKLRELDVGSAEEIAGLKPSYRVELDKFEDPSDRSTAIGAIEKIDVTHKVEGIR